MKFSEIIKKLFSKKFIKLEIYAFNYKYLRIKNNYILYESFFGRGVIDNPYALFKELLQQKGKKYKHYWVLDNFDDNKIIISYFKKYKNVHFVRRNSYKYVKLLCSCRYLINNVTFPSWFIKKEKQIYINTWHGIPLKTLGYDMPNGNLEVSNTVRNFLMSDYLISPNDFLKDLYLGSAFKLSEIYNGKIVTNGYPRLDSLKENKKESIISLLHKHNVKIDPLKKIILYAPTWKGSSYTNASSNVEEYFQLKDFLEKNIDTSKYQILIKPHQRIFQLAKDKFNLEYCIPACIDANEILSISDILISDFSSIFFDFLATHKPVLFYINDLDNYKQDRGLYFNLDFLPGPISQTLDQLTYNILNISDIISKYSKKYIEVQKFANVNIVNNISRNIVEGIFDSKKEKLTYCETKKTKQAILFNRGPMYVNGISTSFLNLLNHIDYSKFDVSIVVQQTKKNSEIDLINKINKNCRVFAKDENIVLTFNELVVKKLSAITNLRFLNKALCERENRRYYNDTKFDYAIDFEGYHYFNALLISRLKDVNRSIWQHNDMDSEKKLRFPKLVRIFNIYKYFDNVISCGEFIYKVNANKLIPKYYDEKNGKYAKNLIDVNRIKELQKSKEIVEIRKRKYFILKEEKNKSRLIPLIPEVNEKGERNYRLVNVARLSPEKNQLQLIEAVGKLVNQNLNVYLYLIGDGKSRKLIENKIKELNLSKNIIMTYTINNPIAILDECDCFILPSLHEGQPMTVNEARMLQKPIIMSQFESVDGVKIQDGQYLCDVDCNSIEDAILAFIDGKVPSKYIFNADSYNNDAYKEFLYAIGVE